MRPEEPPPVCVLGRDSLALDDVVEGFGEDSFGDGAGMRRRCPIDNIAVDESPFAFASSLVVMPLRFATAESESPDLTV